MKQKMSPEQEGFTLIELMIVVAVIGILASVAIPQFMIYRTRSYNSAATSDVVNIQKSEAAFFSEWSVFGSSQTGAVPGLLPGILIAGPGNSGTGIGANNQFFQIVLSSKVSLIVDINANGLAFTASCKHFSGNRAFAVESDTTAAFMLEDATTQPGSIWITDAGANPTVTVGVDLPVGNWIAI